GKGKKAKTVTTKETRAKEFVHIFVDDEVNYLVFLQAILDNHHLSKYKVSDQAVFPCKVQVPPASKSDAMYIINFDEYKGLVTKIGKRTPSRPIIIFVEMPEVEKVFAKVNEGDGPAGNDSDEDDDSLGLTKVDYELARFCRMLEKKYGTDHNGTYSYIDPMTATAIPLTPFMMKEWARAMYDGAATVNNPPNTVTFDHTVHKSSLGSHNCAQSSTSSSSAEI
ncbi:hypothetical protein EI94DRAFT_1436561, partial [Lactarius quietus]